MLLLFIARKGTDRHSIHIYGNLKMAVYTLPCMLNDFLLCSRVASWPIFALTTTIQYYHSAQSRFNLRMIFTHSRVLDFYTSTDLPQLLCSPPDNHKQRKELKNLTNSETSCSEPSLKPIKWSPLIIRFPIRTVRTFSRNLSAMLVRKECHVAIEN